jgi:hypothetical protein
MKFPVIIVVAVLFILLVLPRSARAQCDHLHYYDVDSDKVYKAGQQIRYMETRGAYTGFLSVDDMYFACSTKVVVKTHKSLGSSGSFEAFDDTGTVTVHYRKATDTVWSDETVNFLCEERTFTVGKMERAVSPVVGKMQIGDHNSICELPLPPRLSPPPSPVLPNTGQKLMGRYFTTDTLVKQMNDPATEGLAQTYLMGAYDLAQESGRSCAVRGTTSSTQLEQVFADYLASHPAIRQADRTAAGVAADAFAEHWPCGKR